MKAIHEEGGTEGEQSLESIKEMQNEDEGIEECHIPDQSWDSAAVEESTPAIKIGRGHKTTSCQRWAKVGKL